MPHTVVYTLLFFTFSVLLADSEKLFYAVVANPARGLLNMEKRTKRESLAAQPPPPRCLYGENKIKIKHGAHKTKRKTKQKCQKGIA